MNNINIDDISNHYNDDNPNYNIYNNSNIISKDKKKELNKNIVSNFNLALINIKKRCREKLLCYNCTLKKLNIKIIDDILSYKNKHFISIFTNILIWNDPLDYLKRYYFINESEYIFNPIAYYYNSYTYFIPNYYCNLEILKILLKNIKMKTQYLNEKESMDYKRYNRTTQNNDSTIFVDDDFINYSKENDKDNEKEIIPLFESSHKNEERKECQSQLCSNNKESISLSSSKEYDINNIESFFRNLLKNKKSLLGEENNINDLSNIDITPIKNNKMKKVLYKDLDYKNDINNKNKEKLDIKNYNCKQNLKTKNIEENELVNCKNEFNIKKGKVSYNKDNQKINIKFSKKNKNIHTYCRTDYNDINSISLKNKFKNKELNNLSKKIMFHSFLKKNNNIKDSSIINQNKINIRNETKNIDYKCFTQGTKLLDNTNNRNRKCNNSNSLIIFPKKNFLINNNQIYNSNFNAKKHYISNNKGNLHYNYFDNSKYSRLITSYDSKNHFSLKKNIEFPSKFYSLNINKRRSLKKYKNIKTKFALRKRVNIYLNHSNNSSISKTKRQTSKKSSQRNKERKIDIFLPNKRNILLLNLKNIKKNLSNNRRKKKQASFRNINNIQNSVNTSKNSYKNQFYEENYRNNTFRSFNKSRNKNKLQINKKKKK